MWNLHVLVQKPSGCWPAEWSVTFRPRYSVFYGLLSSESIVSSYFFSAQQLYCDNDISCVQNCTIKCVIFCNICFSLLLFWYCTNSSILSIFMHVSLIHSVKWVHFVTVLCSIYCAVILRMWLLNIYLVDLRYSLRSISTFVVFGRKVFLLLCITFSLSCFWTICVVNTTNRWAQNLFQYGACIHCVSMKRAHFVFDRNFDACWPIFLIFGGHILQ